MIPIFDGHNDVVKRLREYGDGGVDFLGRSDAGHLDLLRAREGGMVGGFFAMFVWPDPAAKTKVRIPSSGREVPMAGQVDSAFAQAEIARQLHALKAMAERSAGAVRVTTTVDAIEEARKDGALAMVLHMEGAEAIGPELRELETLYAEGLRSLGLVWSRPNRFGHGVPFAYGHSPDTGPGLTEEGRELVRACNRMGVMIDMAHLNERGFWDVAELSDAPLVATHTCVHAICPATRNLSDRQLDAVRASDGVVGVNFSVPDVRPDGRREEDTPLEMLARHFVYLVERLGEDRVAIGSDFDGATISKHIGDASGLQKLMGSLREHGFGESLLRKIGFENWMRVLRLTWK